MATARYLPIVISGTTSVQSGLLRIGTVYWYNPGNIGDVVTLQDDLGSPIWQGRCEVANQSQVFKFPRSIDVPGYQVPTISSGTLYIYCQ